MPIILTLFALCGICWLRAYVFSKLMQDTKDTKENQMPIIIPFFFHK